MLDQTEETPYTTVKVVPGRTPDGQRARQVDTPRRILRMREASQEDALASARHFFASGNGQNQVVMLELPEEVPTTTIVGTTLETSTLPLLPLFLLPPLPPQLLGLRLEVLDPFYPMDHLLGPLQQLLVDHECGYKVFQKVGQMFLTQIVLTWERVVYLNLPCY